jgi:hypothetical protein
MGAIGGPSKAYEKGGDAPRHFDLAHTLLLLALILIAPACVVQAAEPTDGGPTLVRQGLEIQRRESR